MKKELNNKLVCPDCKNTPRIIEDFKTGDLICSECGIVLDDNIIDTRSEWRTFDTDSTNDPSRVGEATNVFDADPGALHTMISGREGSVKSELGRIHVRITGKGGGQSADVMREIAVLSERINLPKRLCDDAKLLYRRAEEAKAFRGKSREACVAACLYSACRQEKETTRTFKEICLLSRVPRKDLHNCYQELRKIIGHQAPVQNEGYIHRFCSNLNISVKETKLIQEMFQKITKNDLIPGKNPLSIAAACIYAISLFDKEQERDFSEISTVTGISEGTIKATYQKILECKELTGGDNNGQFSI